MKKVTLFDLHHQVISAWAELRRTLKTPPAVWSLDYHTDTMPCFRGKLPPPEPDAWRDPATVAQAAAALRHDEHFDWALRAGVVRRIELLSWVPAPEIPAHPGILLHVVPGAPSSQVILNEPETVRPLAEKLLTTPLLTAGFAGNLPGDEPFILDIDCDCILCEKALTDEDSALFRSWLEQAALVTLSRENDWVKLLKLPGETMTGSSIAQKLQSLVCGKSC